MMWLWYIYKLQTKKVKTEPMEEEETEVKQEPTSSKKKKKVCLTNHNLRGRTEPNFKWR